MWQQLVPGKAAMPFGKRSQVVLIKKALKTNGFIEFKKFREYLGQL
jgi:hypothetical protein